MAPNSQATPPTAARPAIHTILAAHVMVQFLELVRYPAFIIPTLSLPALFFLVFGVSEVSTPSSANRITTSYLAFAALGVMLFQFGVGVALGRDWSWERFLRALGVSPALRFGARSGAGLMFLFMAAVPVVVVAETATPLALSPARWLGIALALVAGSIPFALLGVALGYSVEPKAAVPVANLAYLGLAYAGGLFHARLPDPLETISPVFPTHLWADLLRAVSAGQGLPWGNVVGLAAYGAAFFLIARWGFQRDEGKIYR